MVDLNEGEGGLVPPVFSPDFMQTFEQLLEWRRDIRRFRTEPLAPGLLEQVLKLADMAPSVGNSQPWRIALVDDPERREAVRATFRQENAKAFAGYSGEKAELYAKLKLEGLSDAPVQLAVFVEAATPQGHGLGSSSMPETLKFSVAGMIQSLWLAARALGVGVGWVSIIEPAAVCRALDIPEGWELVAYLCVGYPVEEHNVPELERVGWQARTPLESRIVQR